MKNKYNKKRKEDHPLVVIVVFIGIMFYSCQTSKYEKEAKISRCERSEAEGRYLEFVAEGCSNRAFINSEGNVEYLDGRRPKNAREAWTQY